MKSFCSCGIVIQSPSISCFDNVSITFRGSTETQLVAYLQEWVSTKATTVQVQGTPLTVDKYCKVIITSLDDGGCFGAVTNDQQSSASYTTVAIPVAIVACVVLILVIILIVAITLVRRRNAKKFIVRYEHTYVHVESSYLYMCKNI